MTELTPRQKDILKALKDLLEQKGYSPTSEEIMKASGTSSKSFVYASLVRLREAGIVEWVDGHKRTLRIVDAEHIPHRCSD